MNQSNEFERAWRAELSVLGALIAALLLFYFRVLVLDNAIIPFDLLGWHYPQLALIGESLRRGEFPLWNPYQYGGMPLSGNIQAAIFYPVNVALLWLAGQVAGSIEYRFIEWMLAIHYVGAGWAAYQLARTFPITRVAACVAGLLYMLGPFLSSQAQHFGLIAGSAWVPLIFLAGYRTIVEPGIRWPTFLAAFLSLQFLAGFLPGTMSLAVGLVSFFIWGITRQIVAGRPDWRRLRGFFLRSFWTLALTAGLAAIQVLPFLELGWMSVATGRPAAIDARPLATTLTIFLPGLFNAPTAVADWHVGPFALEFFYMSPMMLSLIGVSVLRGGVPGSRWIFFGVLCALLGSTNVIRLFGPALQLLPSSVGGAFEWYTLQLLSDLGASLLAGIGLNAVMASRGRGLLRAGWPCWLTLGLLTAAILFVGAAWWLRSDEAALQRGPAQADASIVASQVAQALGWVLLTAIGLWILLGPRYGKALGVWRSTSLLVALLAIPIFLYDANRPVNIAEGSSRSQYGPKQDSMNATGAVAFLQARRDTDGQFRLDNSGVLAAAWGTLGQLWGLENANGNDPLLPASTQSYRAAFGIDVRRNFRHAELSSPLLNLLNVRYVVASAADGVDASLDVIDARVASDQFHLVFSDFYKVFENRSTLPRSFVVPNGVVVDDRASALSALATGSVDPLQYVLLETWPSGVDATNQSVWSPSAVQGVPGEWLKGHVLYESLGVNAVRARISDSPGGFLVTLDPYWPGWVATVNGQAAELLRANYLFRAVPIPPGDHVVEMRYQPVAVQVGSLITAITILIAALSISHPEKVRFSFHLPRKAATGDTLGRE